MGLGTKKLFIDNFEISHMDGLKRRFHSTVKHPQSPVISPEHPWELKKGWEGTACPKVIYDDREQIYKMWYWSSVEGLKNLYATSKDGLNWEKPILNIVEFEGSTDNNIVSTPGRIGPGAVLYSPEGAMAEGEDKLYRTMSWVPSEKLEQRYVPIFSADGLRWHATENADEEPGISGPGVGDTGTVMLADDHLPMLRDDLPGRYVAFPRVNVKIGRWLRRSVGMTACNSSPYRKRIMLDWPHPSLVLAPDFIDDEMARERLKKAHKDGITHFDDPDDHHCEFYTMQPWRVGDVFLGAVYVFDISMNMDKRGAWNQHGIMETQLVYSRDLVHWERLGDRQPWIARGEQGSVDDSIVHFSSIPVQIGDQMFVYYTATNIPHPMCDQTIVNRISQQVLAGDRHAVQHVGCATFRPDGYISLEAGEEPGKAITKTFTYTGNNLLINADAEQGEITVAVCGAEGHYLDGFVSEPIRINTLDCIVKFPKNMETLEGSKISLEFTLRNSRIYSYTI